MATPVLTYLVVIVTDTAQVQVRDLALWVYAAVYGSSAAQASGLLALLILRMHRPRQAQQSQPTGRVVSVLFAVAVAAWHLHDAAGGPLLTGDPVGLDPIGRVTAAVTGALALASALSLMMMPRSVASGWVALAWVSSGATACFSAYLLLIGLLSPQQPDAGSRPLLLATLVAGSVTAVAVRREFHRRIAPQAA